ncbi:MAG: DUF6263 family protein, partial [Chitinophagaceae bacterium]
EIGIQYWWNEELTPKLFIAKVDRFLHINNDPDSTNEPRHGYLDYLNALKRAKFDLMIDDKGQVRLKAGEENLSAELSNLYRESNKLGKDFFNPSELMWNQKFFNDLLSAPFLTSSDKKVGDKWSSVKKIQFLHEMDVPVTYKVTSIDANNVEVESAADILTTISIDSQSKMAVHGKLKGVFQLDNRNMIKEATIEIRLSGANERIKNFSFTFIQTIKGHFTPQLKKAF